MACISNNPLSLRSGPPSSLRGNKSGELVSAVAAVATFFSPPREKYYLDPASNVKYHKPNSASPLALAMSYLPKGDYAGCGINKNQVLPHPGRSNESWCCDIVYFVKKLDQLDCEQKNWKWTLSLGSNKAIEQRQIAQAKLRDEIGYVLGKKCRDWGYDSFYFSPSRDFKVSPFSAEDTKKMHAVILFHQKVLSPNLDRSAFSLGFIYRIYPLCELFCAVQAKPKVLFSTKTSQENIVSLLRVNQIRSFFTYNSKTGNSNKISNIIVDFPYKELSDSKLIECLKTCSFQLVDLSDGSQKLYIRPRLLGGMVSDEALSRNLGIDNERISDQAIAQRMIRALPEDTYSYLSVQTTNYCFPGTTVEKRIRQIDVTVGNWSWFVNLLKAVAAQPIHMIQENQALSAILGSQDNEERQALVKLYKKNYQFRLYISYDLQNFYFDPQECVYTKKVSEWCVIS